MAPVGIDDPFVAQALRVDSQHHTLAAELRRDFRNEFGALYRRRVDAHFISAGEDDGAGVVDRVNAAAHRKRDVDFFRNARDEFRQRFALLDSGGDVQKDQFVGAFLHVTFGEFHRIAGIADIDKIDAFNGTPVLNVEAGNDSFLKHEY